VFFSGLIHRLFHSPFSQPITGFSRSNKNSQSLFQLKFQRFNFQKTLKNNFVKVQHNFKESRTKQQVFKI